MKKRRIQLCSRQPYLSPVASPRELSPERLSFPGKPGGCSGDLTPSSPSWNCFSLPTHRHQQRQQHSPPSSSASSVASFPLPHKTPATAAATAPTPAAATTTSSMASSRPSSRAALAAAYRPTLQDILSNTAPPPWTLGAFMAYLSQNHCLETLEFTMEAERYRETYGQVQLDEAEGDAARWSHDARDYMLALWQKLINAYILPCAPREVNLPGPVRDYLLALDRHAANTTLVAAAPAPPHPDELDEAVQIVYELMNDSVLLSFVDSVNAEQQHQELQQDEQPLQLQQLQQIQQMQQIQQLQQAASEGSSDSDDMQLDARQGRSRRRNKDRTGAPSAASASSSAPTRKDSSRSPKPSSFLPQLALGRRQRSSSPSSPSASSVEALDTTAYYSYDATTTTTTSTSAVLASPAEQQLQQLPAALAASSPRGPLPTPPTTPPTSDWNLSTSPTHISINDSNIGSSTSGGGLQRALTAHNAGWKRVSAKLGLGGLNRMGRSSRPRPGNTSSGEAGSASMPAAPSSAPAYGDNDMPMGGTGQAL